MNRIYRRQRHIYDLTRKYYLLGRDQLIDGLDAGAGTRARDRLRHRPQPDRGGAALSAGAFLRHRRVDRDARPPPIEAIARAGLSSRVRVAHADAAAFDPAPLFGRRAFDRIFISYSLSMIPQWRAALDQAVALLAPRGELHIVDFGGQRGLAGLVPARAAPLARAVPRDAARYALHVPRRSRPQRRRGARVYPPLPRLRPARRAAPAGVGFGAEACAMLHLSPLAGRGRIPSAARNPGEGASRYALR